MSERSSLNFIIISIVFLSHSDCCDETADLKALLETCFYDEIYHLIISLSLQAVSLRDSLSCQPFSWYLGQNRLPLTCRLIEKLPCRNCLPGVVGARGQQCGRWESQEPRHPALSWRRGRGGTVAVPRHRGPPVLDPHHGRRDQVCYCPTQWLSHSVTQSLSDSVTQSHHHWWSWQLKSKIYFLLFWEMHRRGSPSS